MLLAARYAFFFSGQLSSHPGSVGSQLVPPFMASSVIRPAGIPSLYRSFIQFRLFDVAAGTHSSLPTSGFGKPLCLQPSPFPAPAAVNCGGAANVIFTPPYPVNSSYLRFETDFSAISGSGIAAIGELVSEKAYRRSWTFLPGLLARLKWKVVVCATSTPSRLRTGKFSIRQTGEGESPDWTVKLK